MRRCIVAGLLFLIGYVHQAGAQEIVAAPAAKMAPGQCPGNCVQVEIRNLTPRSQELKVRNPGGNWQTFRLTPQMGLNFRCTDCDGSLEAQLPDGDKAVRMSPGVEYDIRYRAAQRQAQLIPRGE